ncbi:cytochrome P450 [uncultured Sphingomonas sp.]|uniref:cytochrome P450 n=1 Tax=uncultured Sphingomonas sp. TaxID=158754 RepID=UPI002619ADFF|nr:cytochrome P450 [uncultured Sphingomonas sp.]
MQIEPRFNLIDPSTFSRGHPHEAYDWLREHSPVWRHPGSARQPEFWALTRFEDIRAVSLDGANFTSTRGFRIPTDIFAGLNPEIGRIISRFMLAMDNPEHQEFRAIVSSAFMPAAIARAEPRIKASVDALISGLRGQDLVDVVPDVAALVPIKTICAIMGVPEEDEWRVFQFTNAVFGADDPDFTPNTDLANERYLEIFDYAWHLFEARRREPRDDLLTRIAHATVAGRSLTPDEQKSFFSNLIAAGNETTRSSLAGAIWALALHPDQRRVLLDQPELLQSSLPELLRWFGPVIQMSRTAIRDVEVGGVRIETGERVAMLYAAGNRDPAVFADPHRLDLRREGAAGHLTFGYGVHHCLGSRLALLQLRLILSAFLAEFPGYELAGEPTYLRSNLVRAMKTLPIRLAA